MRNITKIQYHRVEEDKFVPARVTAFRRNGSVIEAGDRFIRDAVTGLFSLITGKQLQPRDIRRLIERHRLDVDSEILDVL